MTTGSEIKMDEPEKTPSSHWAVSEAAGPLRAPGSGKDAPGGPPSAGGSPWRWLALVVMIGLGYWGWRHFMQPAGEPAATDVGASPQPGSTALGRGQGNRPPVGVATVAPRDIRVVINALGTVTPLATVTLVSQISGYLQQVAFTEGQRVKKGDFLAQIDPRPYQALKAQYEGQLAHDQGLLAQAQADAIRYQTLLKQNSIARQTTEDQIYVVQQYKGTVAADQAQIDAQALNIAYCHIVSPVDGRVGLRLVDPGNFVQAGSAGGIAVVTQLQPMSVIFAVPEDTLSQIAPKMHNGGNLTATAFDRANVRQLATGVVTVLDNQVDTTTGMVKLRAIFENQDESLFPNLFVNIRLLVDTKQGVIAAPTAGIQHGAPGDYAYVVDANNNASVRVVKLGQTDGDYVEIKSGLAPGDRVVVDGADSLREGMEVRVVGGSGRDASGEPARRAPAAVDPSPGQQRQRGPTDDARHGAATDGATK